MNCLAKSFKTSSILIVAVIISIFLITTACNKMDKTSIPTDYNIVWNTQSKNASESMPLVGGDIGCNVWVENGDLLLYIQRSGSLSENGEYLKLGRFRLQLSPNPFTGEHSFQQELNLEDGYIEIESKQNERQIAKIKLWVDLFSPVVYVDVESAEKTEVHVAYESWRTEDKELAFGKGRFGAFGLEGYPGRVVRSKDHIEPTGNGILFYHRNPEEKLIPEVYIKEQGLEAFADEINDDLKNRTFGGLLTGTDLIFDGTDAGTYQGTPYTSWRLKSDEIGRAHV